MPVKRTRRAATRTKAPLAAQLSTLYKKAPVAKPFVSKAPVASEYQEQSAVITWWAMYSKTRGLDERLLFSLPNGAHLAGDARGRAISMNRLKLTGLRAGVPDLMLAEPKLMPTTRTLLFAGLFIEMKRVDGKGEPHQIDYINLLRAQGYNCVICCGAQEAIRCIKAYIE